MDGWTERCQTDWNVTSKQKINIPNKYKFNSSFATQMHDRKPNFTKLRIWKRSIVNYILLLQFIHKIDISVESIVYLFFPLLIPNYNAQLGNSKHTKILLKDTFQLNMIKNYRNWIYLFKEKTTKDTGKPAYSSDKCYYRNLFINLTF